MKGWVLVAVGLILGGPPLRAEIVTDRSMNGARVELQGPDYEIEPNLGRRVGANLFHSFERFNVGAGERARFSGPPAIARLIARVTGGTASFVDGLVEVAIPGADFWFINPRGVIFGPDASLEVSGSVFVSSADHIRFNDGATFSARDLGSGSLSVAAPEAFGFLDGGAGPLELDRTDLKIAPDRTVALVGGDITIADGSIALDDLGRRGDVTLVAMSRPGFADPRDGEVSAPAAGRIHMTGARRNLIIRDSQFEPPFADGIDISSVDSSGQVRIRAGRLVLEGAEIRADNFGDDPATARIDISANHVLLIDNANIRTRAFFAGRAGNVKVQAESLELFDGGLLRSETQGAGDAGRVRVEADSVMVARGVRERTEIGSVVLISDAATGRAGAVTIDAGEVLLQHSGTIASTSSGPGDAGSITVRADRVRLESGAQIASGTLEESTGRGGRVTVTAREVLEVVGDNPDKINSKTLLPEPSGIFTSSESSSSAAQQAGSVSVRAPVIRIADRGEISSESLNNGADSGRVSVRFGHRLDIDDGEITTKAERGDAGDIAVVGSGILSVSDGGEISTTVFRDESLGNAGRITVGADLLVLNRGDIEAKGVRGRGGAISVTADQLIRSADSVVSALSGLGIDGTVSLDAPDTDVVGQLTVLPGAFVDASNLLRRGCGERPAGTESSTFTSFGRQYLPSGPDAPLTAGYSSSPAQASASFGSTLAREC